MRLRDIKTVEDHIKAVAAWLDENVETPSTPRVLTIHDIQINRLDEPRGSFTARLDGTEFPGCTFMTQQNGHFGFCPPMYCSPLGAPASYAAVEFTADTIQAMLNALHSVVPPVKSLGIDREDGGLITMHTPFEDRIRDVEAHSMGMATLQREGLSIVATGFLPRPE